MVKMFNLPGTLRSDKLVLLKYFAKSRNGKENKLLLFLAKQINCFIFVTLKESGTNERLVQKGEDG